jgi:thiamine kinase-like enzyme
MSNTPQQALLSIAGWEDAVCTELKGGDTNRTWLVTSGSRRGVLKTDASPRTLPYNTRIAERRVQSVAADAGIANTVLFASESAYLTEYVHGEVWTADNLRDEEQLPSIATLLRTLHSLPLTGRRADAVDAANRYARTIDSSRLQTATHCMDTVNKIQPPDNLCCCHNDLVAGNIVATPELRLLDWEYACDNDPLFDLATLVAHHDLSQEHSEILLNAYFAGDGDRWQGRLEQQVQLYNALAWLWCASRPEPDATQLAAFESRLR